MVGTTEVPILAVGSGGRALLQRAKVANMTLANTLT